MKYLSGLAFFVLALPGHAAVGLIGNFYNLPANGGTPALLVPDASGALPLESLTPVQTVIAPNLDFGQGTNGNADGPGTFITLTRGGGFGNIFNGIDADSVNDSDYAALFTGSITLDNTAEYRFTTRSDDGSRIWLDLNNDSVFDAAELVADRNFDTGTGNTDGPVLIIPAGTYNFRAGYYERGGRSSFQFGFSERPVGSTDPFATPIVAPPSVFNTLPAPAAVPEPTRALLGLGGLAAGLFVRRKKQR